MEVLAKTEYQDLYRVTDGVLLVVNKFVPIKYENEKYYSVYLGHAKVKSYSKGCQLMLKELKEDYHDEYRDPSIIPKGTVIYNNRPVISTDNKEDWNIQIKTTGEAFNGNYDEIQNLLSSILHKIRTEY